MAMGMGKVMVHCLGHEGDPIPVSERYTLSVFSYVGSLETVLLVLSRGPLHPAQLPPNLLVFCLACRL